MRKNRKEISEPEGILLVKIEIFISSYKYLNYLNSRYKFSIYLFTQSPINYLFFQLFNP